MASTTQMAEIAALIGEPARAAMLQALMDGRALTATELARAAGITPQTASGHLAQLTGAGLLAMERQGRHRYHHLASPKVAGLLENLMQVAVTIDRGPARRPVTGPRDPAMRLARTCYDHLAGRLGVAIADSMSRQGFVELGDDAGLVTPDGARFLATLGIDADLVLSPKPTSRLICRPCLDWSERRPHLAGRLGAALCRHCIASAWVRKRSGSRALEITPAGDRALRALFGFERQVDPV